MALTTQQIADVRRFAGYPMLGTDTPADDSRDFAYGFVSPGVWQTLFHRLSNLTPENESTLITVYLTNLYTLENAIVAASGNLDTAQASVWVHNANEVGDRKRLFDDWRRRMCGFLGIAPGPALGTGIPVGWDGMIEFERNGPAFDAYFSALEAAYFNGQNLQPGTITEIIQEPGGGISQFRYTGVTLRLDDPGSWRGDSLVNAKVHAFASRRIQVQ